MGDWQVDTGKIIQDGGTEIILHRFTRGAGQQCIGGPDCPAELQPPGRTFVPLRFVSETGARVDWYAVTKTITITR